MKSLVCGAGVVLAASFAAADTVWLDEPGLWERLSSFHSCPHVTNRWTVASGEVLEHCVIGCSDNALVVGLHGNAEQFSARVAQKNATSPAVVQFKIWKEDKLAWVSPEVASNTLPVAVCLQYPTGTERNGRDRHPHRARICGSSEAGHASNIWLGDSLAHEYRSLCHYGKRLLLFA